MVVKSTSNRHAKRLAKVHSKALPVALQLQ